MRVNWLPSPADRPYTGVDKEGHDVVCQADDRKPTQAFVWKTVADPFAGRITMFRVIAGAVKTDSNLYNKTRDSQERLAHVVLLQGKTQTNVPEVKAGDIGAVAKLKDTLTNDTLGDRAMSVTFPGITFLNPCRFADRPAARRRGQDQGRCGWRKRIHRSNTVVIPRPKSCCCPTRPAAYRSDRCKKEAALGVDVNGSRHDPARETIKDRRGARPHKKQTGGHGQFGDSRSGLSPWRGSTLDS
jgi:elongation factor G